MSRSEESIKGIVLKQIDYKDNDAIINVLSSDGKLYGFYARGVKKVTSKNANATMAFLYSQFNFFKSEKGLHTLKSAKTINNYFDKFKDYNKVIVAFMLLDVVNDIASLQVDRDQSLFDLLENSLIEINNVDESILLSYFLIKVMKIQGVSLVVDFCAICKSEKINYISFESGGFICHNCAGDSLISSYNLEVLKLFRIINKIDLDNLNLIQSEKINSISLLKIIYEFYNSYTGLYIKNFDKMAVSKT